MGIELDVLVGHHEHELLFVATQVARAAGLSDPKGSIFLVNKAASNEDRLRVGEVAAKVDNFSTYKFTGAPRRKLEMWLFSEPLVYQLLLRGHAPASEPFRKWVTEEVLPTIHKTGKYDAAESSNPIAQAGRDRRAKYGHNGHEIKNPHVNRERHTAVASPARCRKVTSKVARYGQGVPRTVAHTQTDTTTKQSPNGISGTSIWVHCSDSV